MAESGVDQQEGRGGTGLRLVPRGRGTPATATAVRLRRELKDPCPGRTTGRLVLPAGDASQPDAGGRILGGPWPERSPTDRRAGLVLLAMLVAGAALASWGAIA